jgi:triphosphatase
MSTDDKDLRLREQAPLGAIVSVQASPHLQSDMGADASDQPLAGSGVPPLQSGGTARLDADMPANEAFKAIALACLDNVNGHRDAVLGRDAQAVHQMRVAMRRLRVAIWVFSPFVQDEQVVEIKHGLKRYAAELGKARDLEVLIADVLRPFKRQHPSERGFASLLRSFARRRTKAYRQALAAIGSDDFVRFTGECAAWIERGPWTQRVEAEPAPAAEPAASFAARHLARQRKKLLKRGRRLDHLEPAHVHRLRIRTKKLRYTAEFFESLYADGKRGRRWKRFVSVMQRLQDALGAFNDISVRRALFNELATPAHGKSRPPVIFAAGQIVGEQQALARQTLKDAAKALARLEKLKPFWKAEKSRAQNGRIAHNGSVAQVEPSMPAAGVALN